MLLKLLASCLLKYINIKENIKQERLTHASMENQAFLRINNVFASAKKC